MKANFKIRKDTDSTDIKKSSILEEDKKNLMTEEEFEDYIVKSGAAGSFMVFRNFKKKHDEMGIDEI